MRFQPGDKKNAIRVWIESLIRETLRTRLLSQEHFPVVTYAVYNESTLVSSISNCNERIKGARVVLK